MSLYQTPGSWMQITFALGIAITTIGLLIKARK
jgi:hypothetical protein